VRSFDQVGLAEAATQRVGAYSHGMQKRLSIARALLANPKLLLVDEATHDLDPEGAERVRNLVRYACSQGAAVVWATQRLEEIRGLADRVTLLHRGRVELSVALANQPRALATVSGRTTSPRDSSRSAASTSSRSTAASWTRNGAAPTA
jgi:ABC-2 type transport system ATP-binding protein